MWTEERLDNTDKVDSVRITSLNIWKTSDSLLLPVIQSEPGFDGSIWMASSAGCWLISPSFSRWQTAATWLHFVSIAVAWLVTGTDLDTSLLKTSRTCLELIAIGNSRGNSEGKTETVLISTTAKIIQGI